MDFLKEVKHTSIAIDKYVNKTELLYSKSFSKISKNQIWFKQEKFPKEKTVNISLHIMIRLLLKGKGL